MAALLQTRNVLFLLFLAQTVASFTTIWRQNGLVHLHSTQLGMGSEPQKGVELSIIEFASTHHEDKAFAPLPSSHLPEELSTLNIYALKLKSPSQKMAIREVIERGSALGTDKSRVSFGQIVKKESQEIGADLVGAIGCTLDILGHAQDETDDKKRKKKQKSEEGTPPIVVACRGGYRFVVKEVIKIFPYIVAIVDELVDDPEEETNVDVTDTYKNMGASELVSRTMKGLETIIEKNLEEKSREYSPLEISMLQEQGVPNPSVMASQVEERAAVFEVFASSLVDMAPTELERNFAVAMLAAECVELDDATRAQIVAMTDGVARLRIVCEKVEQTVKTLKVGKATTPVGEIRSDGSLISGAMDLKVGDPQLPPWASHIKAGSRVEYYWNDEWEWCPGTVLEDPIKIMSELVVKVRFDTDGETHRLPLNPDEKIRWRPGPPL